MLVYRSAVYDVGLTLKEQWFNVSCLLETAVMYALLVGTGKNTVRPKAAGHLRGSTDSRGGANQWGFQGSIVWLWSRPFSCNSLNVISRLDRGRKRRIRLGAVKGNTSCVKNKWKHSQLTTDIGCLYILAYMFFSLFSNKHVKNVLYIYVDLIHNI